MSGRRQASKGTVAYYRSLAAAVRSGRLPLPSALWRAERSAQQHGLSPATLQVLVAQAQEVAWVSPYYSYVLVSLAYRASAPEGLGVRPEYALALAAAANRLGRVVEGERLARMALAVFEQEHRVWWAASCRLQLAAAAYQLNRYSEAFSLCESADAIFQQAGETQQQAECALILADIHRSRAAYPEAGQWGVRARSLFTGTGSTFDAARCDVTLAYIAVCEQRYDEAMLLLDTAAQIFAEAGAGILMAWEQRVRALIFLERGENQQALDMLEMAWATYRAEHMQAAQGNCERNIANAYRRLGRSEEARALYLRLRQEFARQNMLLDIANCDMNIALTYKDQHRYAEALPYFEAAIEACSAAGLTLHVARCTANMALAEEMLGEYDRALEHHQRARAIFAAAELLVNVAHCDENMARIYLILHDHGHALDLLERAQAVFQRAGAPLLVAANLVLVAQVYQAIGRDERARMLLEQARDAYDAQQMHGHRALCQLRLADIALATATPEHAAALYEQAHSTLLACRRPVDVALCDLGLGDVALVAGDLEAAQVRFTAAGAVLAPHLPEWAWRAQYGLARVHRVRGDRVLALDHMLSAIETIRYGRAGFQTAAASSAYYAGRKHVYKEALELASALRMSDQAIRIIEQSKAQAYLTLLATPRTGLRPRRADSVLAGLLAEEQALCARMDVLRNALCTPDAENLTVDGRQEPGAQSTLLDQLATIRGEHDAVLSRLFQARPLWTQTALAPSFSLSSFRETLRAGWSGSWGALLYFLDDARLTMIYLDAQTAEMWVQPLTAFQLRLVEICTSASDTQRAGVYRTEAGQAARPAGLLRLLFDILIPDAVYKQLDTEKLLVIAPHGRLHALPFHALQAPDGRYLAQLCVPVYTPSLHICQQLIARAAVPRPAARASALVIGVSDFGRRAAPLPMALVEAHEVHRALGAAGTLCLNEDATRAALLAMNGSGRLGAYQIIHCATHTVFEEDRPLQSHLLLHDGELRAADIFDLVLDADLVTLSSCEGARGELNAGDEIAGMAQALFHAGARAMLAGLWKVADTDTCVFMARFYRALRAGEPAASALRNAQIAMIGEGYSPFSWAPFVLVGHPGPVCCAPERHGETPNAVTMFW
jgi:CHAT domain-containing protein